MTHESELIAATYYCVSGPRGEERPDRLEQVIAALSKITPEAIEAKRLPEVQGVPRLRERVTDIRAIGEAVRKYLPDIARDPRLLALSFTHPLRLANEELGIAVSPQVASYLHRALRRVVSFDERTPQFLSGIKSIRWVPKRRISGRISP